MEPFILTLRLDSQSFDYLNDLRQQYFPRERNYLQAHLTLFHALPAQAEAQIRADLRDVAAVTAPLDLEFPDLRFLGKGVAVEVAAPDVVRLRRALSDRWRPLLGAQDARVIKPHITIQNKVTPAKARGLFDELQADWQAFDGWGEGLQLWRYKGGPWEAAGEWKFAGEN